MGLQYYYNSIIITTIITSTYNYTVPVGNSGVGVAVGGASSKSVCGSANPNSISI